MRRTILGTIAALVATAVLTAAMLPVRSHLSIATTALVLVIPVVIGVLSGGFSAGVLSVFAGFLVYNFFFIPPYLDLAVGAAQNWVALGVYVVVMVPVSKVVASMNRAKAEARRQGREIRELFALSDLLLEDRPLDMLVSRVVTTVAKVFGAPQVALLLPEGHELRVAASAGDPLTDTQLSQVLPNAGLPAALGTHLSARAGLLVLALVASGRPVGMLVISGEAATHHEREPLLLFANHIALAVERVQLRDRALQARLAEEVARLAKTLIAAVSHDLRAPLTRIKASSSTLADASVDIEPAQARRLATLIDAQADHLADLVQNLLDMSRIQAGVLQPRRSVAHVSDIVHPVVAELASARRANPIHVEIPDDLPLVDADLTLVRRVVTNLLQNALRFSPRAAPVTIRAADEGDDGIVVSVTDHGPGVDTGRNRDVFELFSRRDGDAGTGLGLNIAKTFVEAHGQRIWVERAPEGGAMFCFTLAVAPTIPEEPTLVADTHY